MIRHRRSTLTPEQQAELASFLDGESPTQSPISPAVLQALEARYRPVTVPRTRGADLTSRVDMSGSELLTAIDAALLLGVSLSTFARSIEPHVTTLKTPEGTRYRRAELVVVGEARQRVRRKRRAAGL